MEGPFAPEIMPPFMRGEDVRKSTQFYWRLGRIVDIISSAAFKFAIDGLENLPDDTGSVLAPNHDNAFDPILASLLHCSWCLPIHWLAKIELFGELRFEVGNRLIVIPPGKMTKFMYAVRCIPITREKPELQSFKSVKAILGNGGVVGIFPEGTRNKDGKKETTSDLKGGAIKFAQMAGVPVVPLLMKSTMPSLWPLRRGTFVIKYGIPFLPTRDQTIEEQLEMLRQSMASLGCFDY